MRYAIYAPPNTKNLAINQTTVAYENQQKRNSICASKQLQLVLLSLRHLMETRLKIQTNYIVPHDKTVF